MNKQIEALKMAIDFMETLTIDIGIKTWNEKHRKEAIQACKEELAEAEQKEKQEEAFAELVKLNQEMGGYEAEKQEPVAWIDEFGNCEFTYAMWMKEEPNVTWTPVYTHPAIWQSLSDDEIEYLECLKAPPVHPDFINDDSWYEFARAIEQALRTKNG